MQWATHLTSFCKALAVAGSLAIAASSSAQKAQLLVYTALETEHINVYKEDFNKAYPDIEIKWVRS